MAGGAEISNIVALPAIARPGADREAVGARIEPSLWFWTFLSSLLEHWLVTCRSSGATACSP